MIEKVVASSRGNIALYAISMIPRFLLCIFHSSLSFLSNHTLDYSYNPLSETLIAEFRIKI